MEEFVEKYGYQIAGDGLSVDGRLVFCCFANDHFNPKCINPFVPISASFPCNIPYWVQEKIQGEIQRLITLLGIKTSTYNFDIRIDKDYNVYLMEIAPRDGGNYIPQVIKYLTGVDLVECALKAAMGEKIENISLVKPEGFSPTMQSIVCKTVYWIKLLSRRTSKNIFWRTISLKAQVIPLMHLQAQILHLDAC